MTQRGAPAKAEKELTDGQRQLLATWDAFDETYLPYRLLLIGKLIDRRATQYFARVNISLAEWRVIAHIRRFGALTLSQVARSALADRAEVCRAAASLEKAGLLHRRANPKNRRSQLLELTDQGSAVFHLVNEGQLAYFKKLCGELTAAERKTMETGLRKMAIRAAEEWRTDSVS